MRPRSKTSARKGIGVTAATVRLRVVSAGLAMVLAVGGCASAPKPALSLTAKDSGSTQALGVGQRLEITLESNPTTGYQWALDAALPACLESAGPPTHTRSSNRLGAGGTDLWIFVGKSPGRAELTLKHWRSFEPTVPPVATFSVIVDVQ
jgi:inhibitor of cysteine peptidase